MSVDTILYKEKVVFKALTELDSRLHKMRVKPFSLKVVGGFALMLEQVRMSDYTDIDYVGAPLNNNIKDAIDEVGLEYGLGRGWINNDVLMSGLDLEDLELSTGKLEFRHVTDMNVISLYSLNKSCILRMKVIAVDTALIGAESNYSFDRAKDFKDIKELMKVLGISLEQLIEETESYVLNTNVYYLIEYYNKFDDISKFSSYQSIKEIIKTEGKVRI